MNKKAFSLIELLLALLVLSVIMHSIYITYDSFNTSYNYSKNDRTYDFNQFLQVLEKELDRLTVEEIDEVNMKIYVSDQNKRRPSYHVIDQFNGQIVKRRSGHQPYLLGVRNWAINHYQQDLWVELEFTNGQTHYGRVGIKIDENKVSPSQ